MNNYKWLLPFALLLVTVFTAPAVSDEKLEKLVQEAERDAARQKKILKPRADSDVLENTTVANIQRLKVCGGEFTIRFPEAGSAHLNVGDRFWVLGPIPFLNAYVIRPISSKPGGPWTHPWVEGSYTAFPDQSLVFIHRLKNIPVTQHGQDPVAGHHYAIHVTGWDDNDCPTYISFMHGEHAPDTDVPDTHTTVVLHPGHAGAIRE